MSKVLLYSIFFFSFSLIAQENKSDYWKKQRDLLRYEKSDKYKGPEDWNGTYPADMPRDENGNPIVNGQGRNGQNLQYNPQQLKQDRERRFQKYERGGKGKLKRDPKIESPEAPELPDWDAPDVDLPDANLDLDPPTIPETVWRILLYLIIFAAVITVIYLILKNRSGKNERINPSDISDDWNPELISKSELEIRLEAATLSGDYRECVRIWFTFILKELIQSNSITWRKEKTNFHYLNELAKQPDLYQRFSLAVHIYDLVWYGDYQISEKDYLTLLPTLEACYQKAKSTND